MNIKDHGERSRTVEPDFQQPVASVVEPRA
jgi:hypothetical protein